MAAQLAAAGIPDAYEGALRFVGNPDLISRTHFARYIVDCGKCANLPEVFRKYLSPGKPGYVEHRWATLQNAMQWIIGAGGIAVIAHPGRYRFSATAQGALFDEFKQLGGSAIEVVTGSHTPDQYPPGQQLRFPRLARQRFPCARRSARRFCPIAAAAVECEAGLA
jgi:hypothetical protein